jgi:hypothetical protein
MTARLERRIRRLERDCPDRRIAYWGAVPIEQWPDGLLQELLNCPQSDEVIRALSDANLRTLLQGLPTICRARQR